jgi:hypothetical protein
MGIKQLHLKERRENGHIIPENLKITKQNCIIFLAGSNHQLRMNLNVDVPSTLWLVGRFPTCILFFRRRIRPARKKP